MRRPPRAMKLVAMLQEKKSVARFLARLGEPTDVPERARARLSLHRSAIIRRLTSGDIVAA